jgi:hypothetical protein
LLSWIRPFLDEDDGVGETAVAHPTKTENIKQKNTQASIDGLPTGLLV